MSERLEMINVRHKVAIVVVACMLSFLATLVSVPDNVLATNHGGWITADETWDKTGNPHNIVRDVRVMTGVTLTILEGVNVSFYIGTSLYVDGDLIVLGMVSEPVTFTSNARNPQAGDWGSIRFNASVGGPLPRPSQINLAIVEYGSSAIYVDYTSISISENTIRYNVLGIHSHYAAPLIEMNSIHDNDNHGIEWTGENLLITGGAVRGNNITNNGGNGINGWAGLVAIRSNDISFNTYGIRFNDSTPVTSQNHIWNNSEDGIYFLRSGNGTSIHNNTLANNSKNGIWVNTSKVKIDNNTIEFNGLNGTYLVNYDGTFENNTVLSNSGNGIELAESSIYAYNNTISSNSKKGLYAQKCVCQISHNMIASNTEDGVYLQYSSNSTLHHNNISYNILGFVLLSSANSTITENELWSTGDSRLHKSSNSTISNNTVGLGAIYIANSDNISIWTNSIESPAFWGLRLVGSSNLSLGDNVILRSNGGPGGIAFQSSENITATNNTVLHRGGTALNVLTSENVILQKNNITSTGEGYSIGIHIQASTNVNITDSNSISNHEIGIRVGTSNLDIVIYDNTTIFDNEIGILCYDSSPIILNNTIEDNEIGIQTESDSTPQIRGNNIEGNADKGVNNTDTVWVDAQNNWWGAADGPGPPGGLGSGDDVSLYVDYLPYLTQSAF